MPHTFYISQHDDSTTVETIPSATEEKTWEERSPSLGQSSSEIVMANPRFGYVSTRRPLASSPLIEKHPLRFNVFKHDLWEKDAPIKRGEDKGGSIDSQALKVEQL
jgi:hypothetical protein